jgi:3,4-dihydroxyphthalate decarboxylase
VGEDAGLGKLRLEVARACRVLAVNGLVDDILGHVSARADEHRLLVRCRGPHERGVLFTTPADIRLVDLDGTLDPGDGYQVPNELPIHTEVLRQRPDVHAVVHAHPPAVVAIGLCEIPLQPIFGAFNIPAMRLAEAGIPTYPRAVLIRRQALAADMLASMGDKDVCLLRGHGIVTAGANVAHAVLRALDVYTLARMSLDVVRAGGRLQPLPPEDLAELPDLGAGFNEALRWRYQLERLHLLGHDVSNGSED